MAIDRISLGNFLKILSMSPQRQVAIIRSDAREVVRKRNSEGGGGGHFHFPFWSDCKDHVFGRGYLPDLSKARIEGNAGRKRLYPELTKGFLTWWKSERAKFNEDVHEIPEQIKGECGFVDLGGTIRVENLLAFKVAGVRRRFIYPYFSEKPELSLSAAQLGLAIVSESLNKFDTQVIEILDILRGRSFLFVSSQMTGNEMSTVKAEYTRMLVMWREFLKEFE